jgi:inorganic triphosphatase YgiF
VTPSAPGEDSVEREVKLEVDPDFVLPALEGAAPGLAVTELEAQVLDATYFDVPSGALLDLGITVRRRTGEQGTRWTVKVPAEEAFVEGGLARREVEVRADDAEVPTQLVSLVEAHLGGVGLGPVARLQSHRRRLSIGWADGQVVAEVDDDTVTAGREGPSGSTAPTVTFREVEVEFQPTATVELVGALVAALVAAGARPGDPRSKVARALAMLSPDPGERQVTRP